jgi:nicotinamide riboside kinase
MKKILVMGLPGSGKTTLATELVKRFNAVHFNADEVRQNISTDLGFDPEDRIIQANRMKWMSDRVVDAGHYVIVDFICPTKETREAFDTKTAFVVWVDRIKAGRFDDTNQLFEPPTEFDVRVTEEGTPQEWANIIQRSISSTN